MLVWMPTNKLPGALRTADGTKVEFADAMTTWIPVARDELIATARRYHAVITYPELSQRVQHVSGITTRALVTNWVGKLLEEVARRAKEDGDPPLTSLCVLKDGVMSPGYARAPKSTTDEPGEDLEVYAAKHRLLCYRTFAEDLPANGGKPALTKAEQQRRARKLAADPAPRPKCSGCFTELPTSGTCDYCA